LQILLQNKYKANLKEIIDAMQGLGNTIDNNVLAIFGNKAPKGVINAIKQAAIQMARSWMVMP